MTSPVTVMSQDDIAAFRRSLPCASSSPARPAGSARPSSPNCSPPATRCSGWPARTPPPTPSPALGAEVHRGALDDLDSLRPGADGHRRGRPPRLQPRLLPDGRRRPDRPTRHRRLRRRCSTAPSGPLVIASGTLGLGVRPGRDRARPARSRRPPADRQRAGRAGVRRPRACARWSCGSRRPCTAPATTASSPARSPSPGTRACRPTSATAATAGRPCTASTPARWSRSPSTALRPARSLHAVAEEGVPTRDIAESIGRCLDLPVTSIPAERGGEHFGWIGALLRRRLPGVEPSSPARSSDWTPTQPGLIADLDAGNYA